MENSTSACPSNLSPLDTATSLSTVETKRVTSLNFMDYTKQLSSSTPHMEATQSNGTKLYFPYRTPNLLPVVPPSSNASTLFQSDSIYTLLHDLRMKMSMEEIPPSSSLNRMGSPLLPHETQLWVDQFQPRKYVDLINDETVSRNVLTWLKSWDIKRSSRRSTHLHEDDVSMGSSMDDVAGVPVDVEKEKKILLLAGPPGLGKTTLIHVIAEQAGYRCMEFNTSDDRTSSMFLPRLQALTGSYTFHQGQLHSQPILVILEELEGMDAAGVLALVQFLQHPSPPPMVGICNDPYGHALKPLRAIAQLIVMRPPTHLAPRIQRLHSICQQHPNLTHVSPAYLRTLVETHQGDLRACLNQLQFLASSPSMTKMTNVFMTHGHEKDLPCSFSDALALLFQSPASVSSSSSSSMTKKRTLADIWSKWTYQDPDRFSMACLDRYLAPHMVHFDQISSVLTTLAEMTSFSTSSQFHVVGYFGFRLFKHTTPHLVPTSFFSKSLDTSHPPIRPSYLSLPTSGTSSSSSSSWILDHRHRLAGDLQGFWNPHTWVLEFWGAFPRLLEIHKMNSVSQPRVEQVVHYLRAYQIKLVASTKEDGSRGFRMEPLRHLLEASALEVAQERGPSSTWVSDIKPTAQQGDEIKFTLTPHVIHSLFLQYPEARKIYETHVPDKLSEHDFWTRFLKAQLAWQSLAKISATESITKIDPLFDKCFKQVGVDSNPISTHFPVNPLFNLNATASDHSLNLEVEQDSSGKHKTSMSMIRKFNQHSSSILQSIIASKPTSLSSSLEPELNLVISDLQHVNPTLPYSPMPISNMDASLSSRSTVPLPAIPEDDPVLVLPDTFFQPWKKSVTIGQTVDMHACELVAQNISHQVRAKESIVTTLPPSTLTDLESHYLHLQELLRHFYASQHDPEKQKRMLTLLKSWTLPTEIVEREGKAISEYLHTLVQTALKYY
ncbi:hypothetical protein HMI56_001106 [Coelomomyces lativittatus]|nr:hypothetical protein HMI56_001106 [Coelomomyces lativittatus]